MTVVHLEKLRGAARGAPAAEFDTAYRCHTCGTIYSFQYGVSFVLFELQRTRSLGQSWRLFLGHARSSVYGRLLSARLTPRRSGGPRWHNLVARDRAVEQRHDKLLATIAENLPDMVRPLESVPPQPVGVPLIVKGLDAGVAEPVKR